MSILGKSNMLYPLPMTTMNRFLLMCLVALGLLITMGALWFTRAEDRLQLAYDVLGAQGAMSQYQMAVDQGLKQESQETEHGIGIEIWNACLNLVDPMFHNSEKFRRICELNVCFQTGIPLDHCQ